MKPELIPAILVKTKKKLVSELNSVSKDVKTVQIDIMDGKFVPFKTVKLSAFEGVRKKLKYEFQLMVSKPFSYLSELKKIKADLVIFHIESCLDDVEAFFLISEIRKRGMKVGIGLNPKTKVSRIKTFLDKIDLVLVMTVEPGKQGQRFKPSMLKKVKQIRKWNPKIKIEVDGGVNSNNVKACVKAGVTNLVVGSAIFNEKDISEKIKDFKRLI